MPRPKSTKPPSRPVRWNNALKDMRNAIEEAVRLRDEAQDVLEGRKTKQTEMEAERERAQWPEHIQSQFSLFETALNILKEAQEEYGEWYDNMPEALQNGATGEKLQEIHDANLGIEPECELIIGKDGFKFNDNLDDVLQSIDELEGIDLPRGFGRD